MSNQAAKALFLDDNQRRRLEFLAASGKTSQNIALRARLVLSPSQGKANSVIAAGQRVSRPTVLRWRRAFRAIGRSGDYERRATARSEKSISPETTQAVLEATLHSNAIDGRTG